MKPLACVLALSLAPAFLQAQDTIPFPAALDAAAITQDRLDGILDNSLILGNGDVNGLLYSSGGGLVLRLTKNDVWDARVDTSNDPPLLKIDVKGKKLINPPGGPESWNKPYPCPRVCGLVLLGGKVGAGGWHAVRAEGARNTWEYADGTGVMSIQGHPDASNGWSAPLSLATDRYPTLRVKVSGTPNAKYYVDVMGSGGQPIYGTKWIPTPAAPEEKTFALPAGKTIEQIILYTWTVDGKAAQNRFAAVTFEGPGGKVEVDLKAAGKAQLMRSVLDIRRAAATVGAADKGATVARALAGRNAFLIDSPAPAGLQSVPASYLPKAKEGETDGVGWLTQVLPGDKEGDWPGMTFAVALAQTGTHKAVAIVTSLESKDPLAAAIELARSTLAADEARLIAEHETAWRRFWAASGVAVGDADLQAMWYRNLYFLRCVSKPGVAAIGLYASLVNDNPPWHGSHTLNYNSEQTFITSYATNHVELGEPYEKMIFDYLPRARWFVKYTYGTGGAYIPHNVFCHEVNDPEKCKGKNHRMHAFSPFAYTIGVTGFAVQNIWYHYKYTMDREFLRTVAYPTMKDAATFYADFMDLCETTADGKVILAPSFSPEHWGWSADFARNRNCAFDIAFARYTLAAAAEGAQTLGVDAGLAARFRSEIPRLPDYPLSKDKEPIGVDVLDAPPIDYNIAVPVIPVWPGDHITVFSDEAQKKLFIRTVERVKWNGYNSSIIMPIARARLSLPDTWQYLKREMLLRSRPNGTITLAPGDGCGHFTEQFAASLAVTELLVQSVGDIVRVFPAWPKDKAAAFADLRAQGGFLVSAEQAGGRVKQVAVISTAGGKLRLVSPWPAIAVRRGEAAPTALTRDGRGIVELVTQPGEKLVFVEGT